MSDTIAQFDNDILDGLAGRLERTGLTKSEADARELKHVESIIRKFTL